MNTARVCTARWLPALILATAMHAGVAFAGAVPAAATDPKETARTLGNRAADAIARGEHAAAEELLRQAYAHYPAPTIALLQARTLVHLGRLAVAASVYERATLTSLGPGSPAVFHRAVEQARREAEQLRPRVPRLQVVVRGRSAQHPEMRISLDGRVLPAAQQGRWILVDPGRRIVRVELGDASSEQVVQVEEKHAAVVEVSAPPSADRMYRAMTWGALGVGAAGVGTGIVTGILAMSAHSRAAEQCPDARCIEGSPGARDLERFRSYRVVSTLGYAFGAAGLGAGGYLWIRGALEGPALRVELDRHSAVLRWQGVL